MTHGGRMSARWKKQYALHGGKRDAAAVDQARCATHLITWWQIRMKNACGLGWRRASLADMLGCCADEIRDNEGVCARTWICGTFRNKVGLLTSAADTPLQGTCLLTPTDLGWGMKCVAEPDGSLRTLRACVRLLESVSKRGVAVERKRVLSRVLECLKAFIDGERAEQGTLDLHQRLEGRVERMEVLIRRKRDIESLAGSSDGKSIELTTLSTVLLNAAITEGTIVQKWDSDLAAIRDGTILRKLASSEAEDGWVPLGAYKVYMDCYDPLRKCVWHPYATAIHHAQGLFGSSARWKIADAWEAVCAEDDHPNVGAVESAGDDQTQEGA